jgi:S13-like H2TH domain
MAGPAGALDDALQQALQAQLAPHAYLDGWRCRYAPAADASALPSPTPRDSMAIAHTAAQVESNSARPGADRPRPGASGAAAADGAVQIAEAERGARPKPVPPPRSGEQRKAALDAARQRNAELKALRAGLQARQLTLAELLALAQSDHAAGRMPVRTALMALPGIRTARASQLMTQAGIGDGCRAGALTAGQRTRLLAAVVAVDAELAARGRRPQCN